jgi:O-antigen/teichoic acid export membrane protein
MALLGLGRIANVLMALLATAIMTRALGPAGYGLVRTALAYLGLAMLVGGFGLNAIVLRDLARVGADQRRVLGNALSIRLLLTSIALAVGCAATLLLPLDAAARRGILVGALGFLGYSLHLILFCLFQQRLRQGGAVLAEVSGGLVFLLAVALLARTDASPVAFVAAQAAAYLLTFAVSWTAAQRLLRFRFRLAGAEGRALIGSAVPLAEVAVLTLLYYRSDTVLVALLHSTEAAGLYGVAIKIYDSGIGLVLLFVGLVTPLLARAAGTSVEDFNRALQQGWDILITGTLGAATMLWSFADEAMRLIAGEAFTAGASSLRVLGALLVVASSTVLFRDAVTSHDLQRRLIPGYLAATVVAFFAYALLIPRYADLGAAVALLLAELVVCGYAMSVNRRVTGFRPSWRVPVRCAVAACVTLVALHGAMLLDLAWPLRLVLGCLTYILLLALLGVIGRSTIAALRNREARPMPAPDPTVAGEPQSGGL